jgi:ubiquinone/menaquinone biosynthesis C-methylase UbiE
MDWHKRYLQQAAWTHNLRHHLFSRSGLSSAQRVLEVGCGSGAVLMELDVQAELHGLDINSKILVEAKNHVPGAIYTCGDALSLPYSPACFDAVYCHYLLLWVSDPVQALCKMRRVTRPGGSILACAEPDYSSRVDEPEQLAALGRLQTAALRKQGADPALGARLSELFAQAGILPVECGVLQEVSKQANQPGGFNLSQERELEWQVLEADLADSVSPQKLKEFKTIDEKAWKNGERRLYVPTYYAWGRA